MKHVKLEDELLYPSKIVCIGRNYVEHIEELNNEVPSEPVIFLKPNSAISEEIYYNEAETIHYEGELTFLTKNREICGLGFGLDLTKREIQSKLKQKGLPWERAKSFDNSAVLSPFIKFTGNISLLRMELLINGESIQNGGYALMLNKPEEILREVRDFITLEDGDLIMSGTPKGVGEIKVGDLFVGKVFEGERLLLEVSWVVKLQ